MTRAAEPGEVVQAGTAVVTLLDLSKVYLRGFVPEGQIGKVNIGQPAHVFLDSNTKQADRCLGVAHRSASHVHAGKHVLSRRSGEAGRRRQAAAEGRPSVLRSRACRRMARFSFRATRGRRSR